MVIWKANKTNWIDAEGPAPQVKVTTLYWEANLEDGGFMSRAYGSIGDEENRVYTLAALEAVPESVVIGWIKQALGDEKVVLIEAGLAADIEEQQTPTSGSIEYD